MRLGTIFAHLFLSCGIVAAQDQATSKAADKIDGLRLELIPDQAAYELGTPVTATLRYTYSGKQPVVVHVPLNDIDRTDGLNFTGTDPQGHAVTDPIANWMGVFLSQHFGATPVGPRAPHEEKIVLNQWLLFDQPGRYTVTVHSGLAAVNEFHVEREVGEARAVTLQSDPVVITITPVVEAHRLQVLAETGADLANSNHHLHWPAIKRVRYLRDPRALPLLLAAMDDPENGPINFEAAAGLSVLPDQQAVKSALLKHLDEMTAPPPSYALWLYGRLLGQVDGLNRFDQTWDKKLNERFIHKATENGAQLSPAEAVKQLVQEFNFSGSPTSPTLEQKRFILQNAQYLTADGNEGEAPGIVQNLCRDPALVPDLEAVAANPKIWPDMRSAAMVALHRLGHDDFQDVIAQDLMSPAPQLSPDAHAMIGAYKQAEIGRALLALLEDKSWEVRDSAADRMPAYGSGISAEDLNRILVRHATTHQLTDSNCFRAVYALAMKSPALAVALIQRIGKIEGEDYTIHDPILCRLEEGRSLVLKVLRTGDDFHRAEMLKEFQQTWWEKQTEKARKDDQATSSWPYEIYDSYSHNLPPNPKLVISYMPEFIRLAKTEPNNEVRLTAINLLATISGIPGDPDQQKIRPEEIAALLPQWEKWYAQHAGDS